MNSTTLFTKTPPRRLFFMAAIPGAVSMLASALYQTLDGVFVGQFLGSTAFAALNLAMPFVIINFAVADLIGVGSSVPISINLGRRQEAEASNIFTCACILIVLTGAVVGAALFAAAPALIAMMGAQGEFARLAVQYLRVFALCSPVTTMMFAIDNYQRICGLIRRSMLLNVLMSVLCGAIELLFLGVLGWGIWAAALANCLGMCTCIVLGLVPFLRGKTILRFCRPRFRRRMLAQIAACGAPSFLNNIAGRLASIVMNLILVRLGGEAAVSVYGVLMFADGFIQPVMYGVCDSIQPAVGYNWGAYKFSRVRALERCAYVAGAVISAVALGALVLFPEPIARMFLSGGDGAALAMAVEALGLFALTYTVRWFSFATQSYMLAIEKPLPASLISVSTALVFPVLLIGLLWPLGLTGIWLNFAGTALLAAVLSALILRKLGPQLRRGDGE